MSEELPEYKESYSIELPELKWKGPNNWREKAACRGMDTAIFFQKYKYVPTALVDLCSQCPSRLHCLEFAIRNDLPNGIYGGLNGPQRKAIKLEDIKVG